MRPDHRWLEAAPERTLAAISRASAYGRPSSIQKRVVASAIGMPSSTRCMYLASIASSDGSRRGLRKAIDRSSSSMSSSTLMSITAAISPIDRDYGAQV